MTSKDLIINIAKQNNVLPDEVENEILNAIKSAIYTDNEFMQKNIDNFDDYQKQILINEFLNFCILKFNDKMQNT